MKLGTIGTSWIMEMFVDAAKQAGYVLHALYSRTEEQAKKSAEKLGFAHTFTDIEAMAQSDIDVVYIASPNVLHPIQAKIFLEHGKHVFAEKPLATDPEVMKDLYETAERNGVYLFEALMHIQLPGFELLKEKMGEIGPIRSVSISYNSYSSKYDDYKAGKNPNVFNPDMHGGATNDIGIYPISFTLALFGTPKSIEKKLVKFENGIDGLGFAIFEYDGFCVSMSYGKVAKNLINNQIIGESGGLVFDGCSTLQSVTLVKNGQAPESYAPETLKNAMGHEAAHFMATINANDRAEYERLKALSLEVCATMKYIRG